MISTVWTTSGSGNRKTSDTLRNLLPLRDVSRWRDVGGFLDARWPPEVFLSPSRIVNLI
jgi:hypothetical protein